MSKINLKERRIELGLTLEQVGKHVGVAKSTVRKWETGFIDNMGRDKIALLAEILQCSPLEILGIDTTDVLSPVKRTLIESVKQMSDKEVNLLLALAQSIIDQRNNK